VDGGATWGVVAAGVPNSANTTGSFDWIVKGPVTNAARIRVTWIRDNGVQDVSDVDFRVASRITVTQPNANQTWGAGSIRTITWNHDYGASQTFDVALSPDNGASWVFLASGVPAATATSGTFTGPMPSTVTTQALLRVSPAGNVGDGDVSNGPSTLATPAIAVTSPNTNVNWPIGSSRNISWSHNLGTSESVEIAVSRDGGSTWTSVASAVPDSANTSGTFNWTVTGPPSSAGRIRIIWTRDGHVQDVSDVNFRIQ